MQLIIAALRIIQNKKQFGYFTAFQHYVNNLNQQLLGCCRKIVK